MILSWLFSAILLPPMASSSLAQIETTELAAIGAPCVASSVGLVKDEDDVAYAWRIEPRTAGGRCAIVPITGTNQAHYWATAGKHRIYLAVAVAGIDSITNQLHHTDILMSADPLPPDPVDDSLAALVSFPSAIRLAALHSDWAAAVSNGTVKTRREFDVAYKVDRDSLKLGDASQAYLVIDERLESTKGIGKELAAGLTAIAEDFASKPQPQPDPPPEPDPVPEKGPRVALIVRETSNDTPRRSAQFIRLRSGTEANYLRENGHRVYILDDDAVDGDGNKAPLLKRYEDEIRDAGIPTLILLDAKSEVILGTERLTPNFTAADIITKIKKVGG